MRGAIRMLEGLVAAAILVAAAAGLPGCGQGASGETRSGLQPGAGDSVARLRPEFSLFRREARRGDGVPTGLVGDEIVARLGLDLSEARLARATPFTRLYAIPGRRAVCLLDTSGVSSPCWPPVTVKEGAAVSTSFCAQHLPAGELQMVGVVPDGVAAVSIVRGDGTRATAQVKQNVFVAQLATDGSLPSRVVWRRAGQVHSQIAGISPQVARAPCAFDR